MRLPQEPVEQIAQQDDGENGDAADGQQQPRHVLLLALGLIDPPAQQQRQHQAVRDHDRQRDGIDDHHGGGGRQTANERQQRYGLGPRRQRQGQHEGVGIVGALGQGEQAGRGNGDHEQVDQNQVDREQPGGAADLLLRVVLDHGHMELPRQQDDAHEAEERHGYPEDPVEALRKDALDLGALLRALEQPADAAKHGEDDEEANRQEGRELDQRLGGNGNDQALLVLGGVDMAGAEQDRERRHRQGDDEGGVGRQIELLQRARAEQRVDREGHRLQLQRDVGQGAGNGDDGDGGGDGLTLAVAGSKEVGDRGDVLALGQPHDAQQEAPAESKKQDRTEVDGEEVVALGGGEPDAAEERPGGAVDRERQGVDQRPAVARPGEAAGTVGIPRQRKQDTDVSERKRDDTPTFNHVSLAQLSAPGGQSRGLAPRYRAPRASRGSSQKSPIVLEAGPPVQRPVVNALRERGSWRLRASPMLISSDSTLGLRCSGG